MTHKKFTVNGIEGRTLTQCNVVRWDERLEEARDRGYFDTEDRKASWNWVTCACGTRSALVPVDDGVNRPVGMPLDPVLGELGSAFGHIVNLRNHSYGWLTEEIERMLDREIASVEDDIVLLRLALENGEVDFSGVVDLAQALLQQIDVEAARVQRETILKTPFSERLDLIVRETGMNLEEAQAFLHDIENNGA